jgi:hypothetical protein
MVNNSASSAAAVHETLCMALVCASHTTLVQVWNAARDKVTSAQLEQHALHPQTEDITLQHASGRQADTGYQVSWVLTSTSDR